MNSPSENGVGLHANSPTFLDQIAFPEEGHEFDMVEAMDVGGMRDLAMMACGLPAADAMRVAAGEIEVFDAMPLWDPQRAEARPYVMDMLARFRSEHPNAPEQKHVSGVLAYVAWADGDLSKATAFVNEVDIVDRTKLINLVDLAMKSGVPSPAPVRLWNDFQNAEESVPVLVAYSSGEQAQQVIDDIAVKGSRETVRDMVLHGTRDHVPIRHMKDPATALISQGYRSRSVGSFTVSIHPERMFVQVHQQLLVPSGGPRPFIEPRTHAQQSLSREKSTRATNQSTLRSPLWRQGPERGGLYR